MLPAKGKNDDGTQVYWVVAVLHDNFDAIENELREKFNKCLEVVVSKFSAMRVIKIKEHWLPTDSMLVSRNHITTAGLAAFWKGVDAKFLFNVKKREEFLTREKYRSLQVAKFKPVAPNNVTAVRGSKRNSSPLPEEAIMQNFFKKTNDMDRFHWERSGLKLPKPSHFK